MALAPLPFYFRTNRMRRARIIAEEVAKAALCFQSLSVVSRRVRKFSTSRATLS